MPKKTRRPRRTNEAIALELESIESIVSRHQKGIHAAAIANALAQKTGLRLIERTLLRRLQVLRDQGRIRAQGHAAAAQYYPLAGGREIDAQSETPTGNSPAINTGTIQSSAVATATAFGEVYVPLSPKAIEVRALIRRPMAARSPVGYHEAFLREYEPGKSWYLSAATRAHLHDVGRTPDANRPAGTFAREICERLLIDLAWGSSRLEGNTYSRLDTKELFETGKRAEGKDAAEAQMLLNHKRAIETLVDQAESLDFNRYTLSNLHALLAENLIGDPKDEGRIRERMVSIGGSTYTPSAIPQKLGELFDLLLDKARAIPDPFEQAFFIMVHLTYLQPFVDVNKRTSRMAANIPLIKANLCPLSFVDVPPDAYLDGTLAVYELNRYELLRDVFVWAYERSCVQYRVIREALGEPDPLRLRYRLQIAEAIKETVLAKKPPRLSDLRAWARGHVIPVEDREQFAEITYRLLVDLHDGAIARYGLRPSEFAEWKAAITTPTSGR